MYKILFKYFLINLLFLGNLFGDIPIGTLIKTNTETKPIEQFSISEKVTSYSFINRQFTDIAIKSIAKYKSKDFVAIQTSSGMLCCGTEAKIFSVSKNNFIKSTNLNTTDILLNNEFKQYPVEKVVNYESEKENIFFILSLEEPHTFFQCDSSGTPFLMHNNPAVFVIEYVIERSPEILEFAASSVLALFGAKVAHDNIKHSHTFNEQRKAESRQRHIESLEDKVRLGKSTIEDQERLQLFTNYPGISDEEVDKKIETNRKYRESCTKNNENVIKVLGKDGYEKLIKYYLVTQQIQANNSANNINISNSVLEGEEDKDKSDQRLANFASNKRDGHGVFVPSSGGSSGGSGGPEDPDNLFEKFKKFISNPNALNHIFGDRSGHIKNMTEENIKRFIDAVKPENYVKTYDYGSCKKDLFHKTIENLGQIWVETIQGKIVNAGLNNIPK